MQIACPACAATYQVPDAMIGEGRQIRCVRCGDEWFARPSVAAEMVTPVVPVAAPAPVVQAAPPEPSAPASVPPSEAVIRRPAKKRGNAALMLAWLLSIAAWGGGLYALWALREPLTELWPPVARLYALLGPA